MINTFKYEVRFKILFANKRPEKEEVEVKNYVANS